MLLLRMIGNINKWDGSQVINRRKPYICGDTISDLRTKDNTLSVWKADSTEEINDAIVALALGRDKVQKVPYIILDESDLEKMQIKIEKQPGNAPGLDSKILEQHRDMVDIDYVRLGKLAKHMLGLVKKGNDCKECSKKDVRKLLKKYRDNNKIDMKSVKETLKDDITRK